MNRKARESAFCAVYQYCITNQFDRITLDNLCESFADDSASADYIRKVYEGVIAHFEEYKQKLSAWSEGFRFERIFKVDLSILLVSLYELNMTEIPVAVSINEAVELSKIYSTEKSSSFINGILASAAKERA